MEQSFTVGLPGDELRSDLRVHYTPGNDPLTIEVQSKVEALFGESLKKQARSICDDLSVSTGRLSLEDFGALPFVVAARVEAVLKKAHPEIEQASLPPRVDCAFRPSPRDRLRRSRLYVPGNQPKLMLNAGIHKPDGLILDMEDSVPPSEKESTRFLVRNALRSIDFFGAERMVRINQGDMGLADLSFVVPQDVHLILVPKVESKEQIEAVDRHINEIRGDCGRDDAVYLMPIIESARGLLKALDIAEASPNIVAIAIGAEDYTADIGTERSRDGKETFFARSMIVNVARAAGIQAIDTVFSDVGDMEGLKASVAEAKSLGFDGKGCVHPRQIQPIHEGFAPTLSEIEKAKTIARAFDDATAKGLGVVSLGSKMIDPPVVKRAQTTLELAIASGLLSPDWQEIDSAD